MSYKLAVAALAASLLLVGSSRADLVVNAVRNSPAGDIDTSSGPVTLSYTLSLAALGVPSETVRTYSLTLFSSPASANIGFGNYQENAGAPAGHSVVLGFPGDGLLGSFVIGDFNPAFAIDSSGEAVIDLDITFAQGLTGTFNIVLDNSSSWDDDTDPLTLPEGFANGGLTIATITAVPEASSFIFCGVVSSLGGFVAWRRRRAQAAA